MPTRTSTETEQRVLDGEALPDGYGHQWWLISGEFGRYSAIGVQSQWMFVSPRDRTTIVKLSATRTYGTTMGEEANYSGSHEAFLRAVAAHVGAQPG